MEYEAFEPDPEDEYYEQMCSAAYAALWNERSSYAIDNEYCPQFVCDAPAC